MNRGNMVLSVFIGIAGLLILRDGYTFFGMLTLLGAVGILYWGRKGEVKEVKGGVND